ncbi:MAG: hypothetical protein R3E64_03410 [Halioglobus sp.]
MSITRRQFLLGTAAGLILPSFYERAYSFYENHGEPLLIAPQNPGEILYASSEFAANGFQLHLGHPEIGPPEMTIREFCLKYAGGDSEADWREHWLGVDESEPVDFDSPMDPWTVLDWWVQKDSSAARAYSYLESLDLGPQLKKQKGVGGLDFYCGGSPGNGFFAVDAMNEVSLSLLQQRLNELGTGIKIEMY